MKPLDIVLLALIALGVVAALLFLRRKKKQGGGCCGCCGSCTACKETTCNKPKEEYESPRVQHPEGLL